jgi:alpha-beta hydrolase superfamily lysophospholipase
MIHFDGFDVTKEWMSLCGIADEFARRGVSTLMLDHPGHRRGAAPAGARR